MKIAVVGSRSFEDRQLLEEKLTTLEEPITEIISGGAPGADTLAQEWAEQHRIPVTVFQPDWKKFGRAAGPQRNQLIISACDVCVAFWDGQSKGTKSSIDLSRKAGKKTIVIDTSQK